MFNVQEVNQHTYIELNIPYQQRSLQAITKAISYCQVIDIVQSTYYKYSLLEDEYDNDKWILF